MPWGAGEPRKAAMADAIIPVQPGVAAPRIVLLEVTLLKFRLRQDLRGGHLKVLTEPELHGSW